MVKGRLVSFVVGASSIAAILSVTHGAAAQTLPSPPAAPDSNAPTAAAASELVLVHIDTPSDVDLEVDFGGGHWRTACASPCDKPLSAKSLYRINGSGVRASHPFSIGDGKTVTLDVDPASTGAHAAGIAVTIVGVAGLAPGAAVTAAVVVVVIAGAILICPFVAAFASKANQGNAYSGCIGDGVSDVGQAYASPYVWVPAALGGLAIVTGITLLATSSNTTVTQSTRATAGAVGSPDVWRTPVWHEVAGTQYPRAVTSPVLDLAF